MTMKGLGVGELGYVGDRRPLKVQGLRRKQKDGGLWRHRVIRSRSLLEGTTAAPGGMLGYFVP